MLRRARWIRWILAFVVAGASLADVPELELFKNKAYENQFEEQVYLTIRQKRMDEVEEWFKAGPAWYTELWVRGKDGTMWFIPVRNDLLPGDQPPTPFIAGEPGNTAIGGMPPGQALFSVNDLSNSVSVFGADLCSGALSPAAGSPYSVGNFPKAMAVEP